MENTITLNMENLSEDERNTLLELIEKSNKPKRVVWEPKYNEQYYYFYGTGAIAYGCWNEIAEDKYKYLIGNCFKTEEEAKFTVEKLKVVAELKRFAEENNEYEIDWRDEDQSKYYLYYSFLDNEVSIDYRVITKQNNVYFTSHAIAAAAIDKIGKDRLKKYYFEVED